MIGQNTNEKTLALRLSLQRALLGEVTPNLIAVTAGFKDSKILIRAYFDAEAAASELESVSCVGTEVIADFPDCNDIEEHAVTVSREGEMEMLDFWAFLRKQ